MCLAIPGKVKQVEGMRVVVEYPHESREVVAGDIKIKPGDYVLVQMGVVIKKLPKKDFETSNLFWK